MEAKSIKECATSYQECIEQILNITFPLLHIICSILSSDSRVLQLVQKLDPTESRSPISVSQSLRCSVKHMASGRANWEIVRVLQAVKMILTGLKRALGPALKTFLGEEARNKTLVCC